MYAILQRTIGAYWDGSGEFFCGDAACVGVRETLDEAVSLVEEMSRDRCTDHGNGTRETISRSTISADSARIVKRGSAPGGHTWTIPSMIFVQPVST